MVNKFTKLSFINLSQEVLNFQLKALYPVQAGKIPTMVNLVFLNHDRNFSTFLTIRYLVEHKRVADVITLSRSMFESIITTGLLSKQLIGNDIERYQDYQYFEICKTYNHLKKLGLEYLSGVHNTEVEFLYKKQKEYIRKFGKNTQTWSGKSLVDNVKLIDENYPPTCNENHFYEYLYCQVYRKGSQSAHSSFAGLKKGVDVEKFSIPGLLEFQIFKTNEKRFIFSCFHSLLTFLSSVRFLGCLLNKKETEDYFHRIAKYIISED